ncbi:MULTISPECIES: hypothetical protein [Mycobacteriaceae]|uniref:Uncharacterized protein n=1 Tax=Mycolicibacter hiberniae TaxID=29314 RepID=A0A7I7X9R9_9MYCO|nr:MULTISPECIES: hypothetical protein [Mycobacteriaceae]MCV7087154.1 hypothetical protein [Mycolicibacter hiberniae]BBZ25633.1 hypothetical protein MHIB_40510 [Mycolicibacter hiberniae]
MLYLLLVLTLGTLIYLGLRTARSRPKTRVIGPDDDPEFLWRISHGDNQP